MWIVFYLTCVIVKDLAHSTTETRCATHVHRLGSWSLQWPEMNVHGSLQMKFDYFDRNTKFLLSFITCSELWIRCYYPEYKHNSSVVIKWLTGSEERTHSTFGTVMFMFVKTECRTHAEKETWVPYKTMVFAPRRCTAMYCTNDSEHCWCLNMNFKGRNLAPTGRRCNSLLQNC
jgi:hypothetical protein